MGKSQYGTIGQLKNAGHGLHLTFSSSRPLALFHTSPSVPSPSFSSDLASSRLEGGWSTPQFQNPNVILIDPVSGDAQTGSSTSGREAARVVKFSPEGSPRDLMVFTEVSVAS